MSAIINFPLSVSTLVEEKFTVCVSVDVNSI